MLTYAQEIDEKLSNCKDSRNKYYQICQQLTTKYSKLKVSISLKRNHKYHHQTQQNYNRRDK